MLTDRHDTTLRLGCATFVLPDGVDHGGTHRDLDRRTAPGADAPVGVRAGLDGPQHLREPERLRGLRDHGRAPLVHLDDSGAQPDPTQQVHGEPRQADDLADRHLLELGAHHHRGLEESGRRGRRGRRLLDHRRSGAGVHRLVASTRVAHRRGEEHPVGGGGHHAGEEVAQEGRIASGHERPFRIVVYNFAPLVVLYYISINIIFCQLI